MNNKTMLVVCVTVILCGILFWPTIYNYDHMVIGHNTYPVRMNRITGYTEYYLVGKWVSEESQKPVPTREEVLPPEEQAKVTGNAGFNSDGNSFEGEIYNGSSNWTIASLIIRVAAYQSSIPEKVKQTKPTTNDPESKSTYNLSNIQKDKPVKQWDRIFKTYTSINPLSTGRIYISVKSANDDIVEWDIKEISGFRK